MGPLPSIMWLGCHKLYSHRPSEMNGIHLWWSDDMTSTRQFPTPAWPRWTTLENFELWPGDGVSQGQRWGHWWRASVNRTKGTTVVFPVNRNCNCHFMLVFQVVIINGTTVYYHCMSTPMQRCYCNDSKCTLFMPEICLWIYVKIMYKIFDKAKIKSLMY